MVLELLQRFEPTHPSLHNSSFKQATDPSSAMQGGQSELRRRVPSSPHPSQQHLAHTPTMTPHTASSPPSTAGRGHAVPRYQPPTSTPSSHDGDVAAMDTTDSMQPFIPPGTNTQGQGELSVCVLCMLQLTLAVTVWDVWCFSCVCVQLNELLWCGLFRDVCGSTSWPSYSVSYSAKGPLQHGQGKECRLE